jgi:hypothetical protein
MPIRIAGSPRLRPKEEGPYPRRQHRQAAKTHEEKPEGNFDAG